MSTSQRSTGQHTAVNPVRRGERCPRRLPRSNDHVSRLGTEIIASKLRVIGHPARLRIMRAVDGQDATIAGLADSLRLNEAAVRAHVMLLYRAGVICRVDRGGSPVFRLADWPSMWLVDQLARRLRQQTDDLAAGLAQGDDDGTDEGTSCR